MSLYETVLDEVNDTAYLVKVWDWVRSQIDVPKFRARANYASNNPTVPVKVVLMEYSSSYRSGDSTTHFYVPNTGINTMCLKSDNRVIDYLHYQLADRNSRIVVYSRRKVVDGTTPHQYLRQLVVKFNVGPVNPTEVPSPIEKLDEDNYYQQDIRPPTTD
jgi:hypothetical protein